MLDLTPPTVTNVFGFRGENGCWYERRRAGRRSHVLDPQGVTGHPFLWLRLEEWQMENTLVEHAGRDVWGTSRPGWKAGAPPTNNIFGFLGEYGCWRWRMDSMFIGYYIGSFCRAQRVA